MPSETTCHDRCHDMTKAPSPDLSSPERLAQIRMALARAARNERSPSQVEWACAALLSGRTIGHSDEINEAQGWRLSAIVWRLKRKYGWPITTEYVGPENRASYKLQPGIDRAGLRFPRSAQGLAQGGAA